MNRYDERYDFYLAKEQDIEDIMEYIDKQWKKGHILAHDRKLFDYEFVDGQDVHFIVVRDRKNGNRIAGINGYYLCSRDKERKDIWGTLWSVRDDEDEIPFLGVEIGKRRDGMIGSRCEIGVGINEKTAKPLLERVLKNKVGKLEHYYMLNDLKKYTIAVVREKKTVVGEKNEDFGYRLEKMSGIEDVRTRFDFNQYCEVIPFKDAWYVNKRFFCHPVYEYEVYGIVSPGSTMEAVIVMRRITVNDSQVLRIVDYIGNKNVLQYLYGEFRRLMNDQVEYIDFYCYGFDRTILSRAGFIRREENDCNIIPNYFEPFLQKNVDIWFNSTCEGITICKADADQDRPNIISN